MHCVSKLGHARETKAQDAVREVPLVTAGLSFAVASLASFRLLSPSLAFSRLLSPSLAADLGFLLRFSRLRRLAFATRQALTGVQRFAPPRPSGRLATLPSVLPLP